MEQALQALIRFRDERDWAQFHDSRNLALALSIEAAELNELFLWKKDGDFPDLERLKEELADVLAYALLLAHNHQLDLESIVLEKAHTKKDTRSIAVYVSSKVRPLCEAIRVHADALEGLVDDAEWRLPKYREMLQLC